MADDVKEIIFEMGAKMLNLAGIGSNLEENKEKILTVITNGKAYEKFKELVEKQYGDVTYIDDLDKFEKAPVIIPVVADSTGYVERVDARIIGEVSVELGVGRKTKEESRDSRTGIVLNKTVGDKVEYGEILAYIHANNQNIAIWATEQLKEKAYKIVDNEVSKKNIVTTLDV